MLAVVDKTGPGHLLDADPETANQANSIYTFLSAHRVTPEQVCASCVPAYVLVCACLCARWGSAPAPNGKYWCGMTLTLCFPIFPRFAMRS